MSGEMKHWFEGAPFLTEEDGALKHWFEGVPASAETDTVTTSITGASGIASSAAFGSDGHVDLWIIGSAGIASSVAFGSTGAGIDFVITGVSGIDTSVAFGSDGFVNLIIVGSAGIPSSVAFGADGLLGDIVGQTGIPSSVAFGSGGALVFVLTGSAGIPSSVAFGDGSAAPAGVSLVLASGVSGIASSVAFGADGSVYYVIQGVAGISSSVAFGTTGIVINLDASVSRFGLYVDGENKTAYLMPDSINITQQLNFADTGSFGLIDEENVYAPNPGESIVMLYLPHGETAWRRIFGGSVDGVSRRKRVGVDETEMFFDVKCVGYGNALAKRVVTKNYRASAYGTFRSIMADLSLNYLQPEGITWIDQGDDFTIGDMEFQWQTLKSCLDKLGEATEQQSRIDPFKNLYFYSAPNTTAAPMTLSESEAGAPNTYGFSATGWADLELSFDRGLYRNRQYVKASLSPTRNTITESYTKPLNIGGAEPVFFSDYLLNDNRYRGQVTRITRITLNSVDIPFYNYGDAPVANWRYRQVTENDIDLYWNWGAYAPPADGSVVEVTFTTTLTAPDLIYVQDDAEIAARAAIEEGSGLYEDVYDAGDGITDEDTLIEIATNILARFKVMCLEARFTTFVFGWETGQLMPIDLPLLTANWTVPAELTVEQVVMQQRANVVLHYTVTTSNKVQQRDAMTAINRLINSLKKTSKVIPAEIQFELAVDIPGYTNPGLEVVSAPGNAKPIVKQFAVDAVVVLFTDTPTGASIKLDLNVDGVSWLTNEIEYPVGQTTPLTFTDFPATTFNVGQVLTIDVTQVGSTNPGSNGTVVIKGRV